MRNSTISSAAVAALVLASCCATPKPTFVGVPSGSFQMGSDYAVTRACTDKRPPEAMNVPEEEWPAYCGEHGPSGWFEDEQPVHFQEVQAFWISRTEVTVAQFRAFVEATDYRTVAEEIGRTLGETNVPLEELDVFGQTTASWHTPWGGQPARDDHPVTHVAWQDARAYCAWLSEETGMQIRLPTEVEWEYAALGGRTEHPHHGTFAWGNEPPGATPVGNFSDRRFAERYPNWRYPVDSNHDDGFARTAPVGSYPANGYDIHDLSGNVWEWAEDVYRKDAYTNPGAAPDPEASDVVYVMRGGSFDFELPFLRIQKRRNLGFVRKSADVRSSISIGFRVATSDPPSDSQAP